MNNKTPLSSKPVLVFDFGNVIIDIDYKRSFDNLCALLEVDWEKRLPEEVVEWIILFESGKITEETFLWKFQSTFNAQLNPRQIIDVWNSMLTGIPEGRLDLLGKIASEYDTYLLSNTNSIHLQWVRNHIVRDHGCTDFDTRYFKKTFYSHEVGMVKPNEEIYAYVTKEIGCAAEDIIFFDDLKANIAAANVFGWNGVLHDPKVGIEQVFDGDGVLKF